MLSQKIIVRHKIIEDMFSEEKGYSKISEVDELKRCINSQWDTLSYMIIECSVAELHQGLRACVHARTEHLEQCCNKDDVM